MEYKQRLLKVYYEVEQLIKQNEIGKIKVMGIPINATDFLISKLPEVYYYTRDNEEKTKKIMLEIKEKIDFLLQDDKLQNKSKDVHNRKDSKRKN